MVKYQITKPAGFMAAIDTSSRSVLATHSLSVSVRPFKKCISNPHRTPELKDTKDIYQLNAPLNMFKELILAAVIAIIFMPVAAVSGTEPPNKNVIDPALEYRLSHADTHERIEVIIQFQNTIEERDLAYLRVHGFRIFRTFQVMPVVYASGEKREIERLSSYERTKWIEYNAPMRYLMNMTKYTIKAWDVWHSQIRNGDDVSLPVNGTGVTVVVLDSGIDGTHPDLSYTPVNIEVGEKPKPGQKLIFNVKKDQNVAGEPFVPFEDTDTSSGHGTHCAGTVAGDGQASAGRIKGIAPGAWLIGVSMGEGFATIDEYSGMVWVYEHSKPGNNPANIRVVSNSWGPGFPFDSLDPNDATAGIIHKIVYENNVAVVFAAGNDGDGDQDGHADTVNIFAKIPEVIGVAAAYRNGTGIASFSSRGDIKNVATWPDIAAPGVKIWSAAARATLIGAGVGLQDLTRSEKDPYYLAISGTSMATPHIAGLVALLWQACPSMRMSTAEEDYEGKPPLVFQDNSGSFNGGPYTFQNTTIHESELILKLTADYIPPENGNGVPTGNGSTRKGLDERTLDYAQGYGLVNAQKAVALALRLQHMRDPNGDGIIDHPDVTVWDAYNNGKYSQIIKEGKYEKDTDRISHSWHGEYVDIDRALAAESSVYSDYVPVSNQSHSVFIPEDTEILTVEFCYNPLHLKYSSFTSIPEGSWSYLVFTIDVDGDGNYDYPEQHPIVPDFTRILNPAQEQKVVVRIDFSSPPFEGKKGRNWTFDVAGYGFGTGTGKGARNEYSVKLTFRLDATKHPYVPFVNYRFEEPSSQYYKGSIRLYQEWFVLREKKSEGNGLSLSTELATSMLLIAALGITGTYLYSKKKFGLWETRKEEE